RRGRAQVDDDLPRPRAREHPALAEHDRLDDGSVRKGEENDVRALDELGDGRGCRDAGSLHPARLAVEAGEVVAGGEDSARDPAAHVADADDADPLPRHDFDPTACSSYNQ